MFNSLSDKLSAVFKKLRGKGKLNEADIKEAMREVKLSLLAADVNIKVVKDFVTKVSERAVGAEVLESLTPAQQVIKIVNEELCAVMGGTQSKLEVSSAPPSVVMLCGLQGAGKTTHAAKLALHLKKQGKHPLLVACDIYRAAAVDQLHTVGNQAGVSVFSLPQGAKPQEITKKALEFAHKNGNDFVLLDTAGRLHIDQVLMDELRDIKAISKPVEILLVIDAMTGQDAVNVATAFDEALGVTGVILTKTDGDTRGGAALSVRYVTGKPIKFIGVGEKIEDLEPFHPERMASRILGMGDMLTLIEKAQASFDEKQAIELTKKLKEQTFDLNDFYNQMSQIKNMGSLQSMVGMIPGMQNVANAGTVDESQLAKIGAIIESMTPAERDNPDIINGSRRRRIALGSGTSVQDVNNLLKRFEMMKKMMKQFSNSKNVGRRGGFKFPF